MRITGWDLPEGPQQLPDGQPARARLRSSALDGSVIVVCGPQGSGKTALARLLAASLYGEPAPAPGEVVIADATGSRALRPGDPPVAEGGMLLASLRDASAAWRPLQGSRSSTAAIDAAIVRAQRMVEQLDEQLAELEAGRPGPVTGEPPRLPEPSITASNGLVEPDEPPADEQRDRDELAEVVDQAAMTRHKISQTTAELRQYASVPPAAELDSAEDSLESLRLLLARATKLTDEVEAQHNTACLLERELERTGAPLDPPEPVRVSRIDPIALIQPLLLVAALGLIAATVVTLLSDDPDRGPLLGLIALGVSIAAFVAPTRALRPSVPEDPAVSIRSRRQTALDQQKAAASKLDDIREAGTELAATLGVSFEVGENPGLDERANDVAAYREARDHADRLTNTLDAAAGVLRETVDRSRSLSLQLVDPHGESIPKALIAELSGYARAAQAYADESARHDYFAAQLRLARSLAEDASEALQRRHPAVLTRLGDLLTAASAGRWTGVAVTPEGPQLLPDDGGDRTRPLADLALALAALEDSTIARQLPVLIDDVTLPVEVTATDAAVRCIARLAERTQLVLFTADTRTRDLLLESLPDGRSVELPGIRVLVTPPE